MLSEVEGTLTNVQLTGCIDGPDSSLLTLGATFSSEMLSVVGLAAVNANLTLRTVNIQGFVGYGLATYGSTISWDTGSVKLFVGVGLMSEKSTVTVANVAITEGLQSRDAGAKRNSFGVVSSVDSITESTGLTIEGIAGLGMLIHQAASAHHDGLSIVDNTSMGIHIQEGSASARKSGSASTLTFEGATIVGNRAAGISMISAGNVRIAGDSLVRGTEAVGVQLVSTDMVLGHGIQSAEGGTDLTLDTLALEDNAIVGLLLDGEGTSVSANEVHVDVARIWDDCDASLAQCFGTHSQMVRRILHPSPVSVSEQPLRVRRRVHLKRPTLSWCRRSAVWLAGCRRWVGSRKLGSVVVMAVRRRCSAALARLGFKESSAALAGGGTHTYIEKAFNPTLL